MNRLHTLSASAMTFAFAFALTLSGLSGGAVAQTADSYPDKPLTFVVPYPPGGAADLFARSFAQALALKLGQPVVVENKAGANGNIGSAYVAKQRPADGYTFLLGSTSTLAINPHLYASMGYDPITDLQPVTLTHQMPNVLLVGAATPYKTVADVIAAAKAAPKTIAFGSAGNGNTMHMAGELFQLRSGISLVHVPYKGGAPALNDVLGGQIPMMFNNLPAVVPQLQSGRIRVLAVADTKRWAAIPNVPTMAEAGVPNATSVVWNGILVRKGTPQAAVQKLNAAAVEVLKSPSFKKPLEDLGFEVLHSTPKEFTDLLAKDSAAMAEIVKRAGITLQ
ncbi:MAG: tripartite tricarboxylate transporter substrate binding protein [Pseudomonadota bacterium]|nr:tripartite tricarboxylate transporter substrate binding protein [Pseudomonadota bacterium]